MGYRKVLTVVACLLFCIPFCQAQNFSGLQNKKLSRVEDLGLALESIFGGIGGSINGAIDSVIITEEYEKELKIKIWYSGFVNGYFTVSGMSASRQSQREIIPVHFFQPDSNSPVEVTLALDDQLAKDQPIETPYLRIDIAKKENGNGKVRVFLLQKNWRSAGNGGTGGTGATGGAKSYIKVQLQPVGVAATLSETQPTDVTPPKMIFFDPKIKYEIRDQRKGTLKTPDRRAGGNSFLPTIKLTGFDAYFDINGTWTNRNPNAVHKSLMITNGNYLRVYTAGANGGLTENAHGTLVMQAANRYNSILSPRIPDATIKLSMVLVFNGDNVSVKYYVNSTKSGVVGTIYTYDFYRKPEPRVVTIIDPILISTDPVKPVSTVAEGPDKDKPQNLWDGIAVDNSVDFGRPQDISNINMTVFPDKNPNSGTWYILPADYHLVWDADTKDKMGYGLSISYGKQGDAGTDPDAPVLIKAYLSSGITTAERNLVISLLKAKDAGFKELKYLPLRENIQTTFQNIFSAQYNIPAEKISVTSSTDLGNTITVACRTNSDTKEFMQTALTSGEGIVGSLILKPVEQGIVDQQIDAIISVSNTRTLGKMQLDPATWRTKEWTNQTAYPLALKYLHVMKKSTQNNKPIIYSWSIDNAEVAPQGRVAFDNSRVPKWLDTDPSSVMWLSYSVSDCDSCGDAIISGVTDGVSGNTVQQLRFVIPDAVFDTLKASYFMVTVRSRQADPKGVVVIELPVMNVTKEAGKNFLVGPLFIPKNGMPDFEYNIKIASTDGEFYISDKWIRSTDKQVLLGKKEMKEIFKGIVPGIN